MAYIFVLFVTLLNIVSAQESKIYQPTQNNCFSCAKSTNFFCHGKNLFENPWEVKCCSSTDKSYACERGNSDITCSSKYGSSSSARSEYFSSCPK